MYETADHHISTYAIFFRLVPVEMTATPSHMSVNCLYKYLRQRVYAPRMPLPRQNIVI